MSEIKNGVELDSIFDGECLDTAIKKGTTQLKKCTLICYLDKDKIMSIITCLVGSLKYYAFILHNQDGVKEHYHVYLEFYKKTYIPYIAKLFGIADNLVENVRNVNLLLQYFIHHNESDKHPYAIECINTNISNIVDYIYCTDRKQNCFNLAIDILNQCANITYSAYLSYMIQKGYSDIIFSHCYLFKSLFDSYHKK